MTQNTGLYLLSSLVGVACLSFSPLAEAQVRHGALTMEVTSLSEHFEFVRKGDRYHVAKTRAEIRTKMRGTGAFRALKEDSTEVDTDVPGKNDNGHLWFELKKQADGTVHLIQDELLDLEGTTFPLVVSGPVVFVKGSYDDYKRGKPVSVKFTKEGHANLEKKTKKMTQDLLRSVFGQLKDTIPGARLKLDILRMEVSNAPIEIHGDKARQSTNAETSLVAQIIVLTDA